MEQQPIFRREFWRAFSIDIRRIRKDGRARKAILVRLGFFAYLIGVCAYYGSMFYSFHDPATAVGMAACLLLMFAIIAAVRYTRYRESRAVLAADLASVPREDVVYVQRLAHGLAAISERALGELWLKNNPIPEGHSAIIRRITLGTLRRQGIWDEMPVEARDWLARPDGGWPKERIALVLLSAETLHTLLWSLGLSSTLRPVQSLIETLDFKKLARALTRPAPGIRPIWDLRVARNEANIYFTRCYAETIHRDRSQAENDNELKAVETWMDDIAENPHEDFLAGTATINELDESQLAQVGRAAANRLRTLDLLMLMQDGRDVRSDLAGSVYASLLIEQALFQ